MKERKYRTRERMAEIDNTIKRIYREKGPDYTAKLLGESRDYIMSRAYHLRIPMGVRRPAVPKKIQQTKAQLIKENKQLKASLKELRLELIKLVDERRKFA